MDEWIKQNLGHFQLIEKLGEGGMAAVYKAYDTRLERFVAVKIILPFQQHSKNFSIRFEQEAKILAKLSHPNIVKILDYGTQAGMPYLVMEYIPGGTLKQRLGKPILWREAVSFILPISQALAYAHRQKIIHRDVKPSNILICESGEPMLTDFGVAKIIEAEETIELTGTGVGIGTPEYMAPEQGLGKTIDYRVDIYSIGLVFYEMIVGCKPFRADTPMAVLLKQMTEPIPNPRKVVRDLPEAVEGTLYKALAKQPEDRYQTMEEFAFALEKLLTFQGSGSHVKMAMHQRVPSGKIRFNRWWWLGLGLALVAVGAFFAIRLGLNFPRKMNVALLQPSHVQLTALPSPIPFQITPVQLTKLPSALPSFTPILTKTSSPTSTIASLTEPALILQRLQVSYLGQDGYSVIGSGCPGSDGKGSIINYHLVAEGVDASKLVRRVIVVADNSTMTWEWPCSDSWGLVANDKGNGTWDIYISPSLATQAYAVIFFYSDNSMALGITRVTGVKSASSPMYSEPSVSSFTPANLGPTVVFQRLQVSYLGLDGATVIGSGCPGKDGQGSIIDYHLVINGVDVSKQMQRVLVAGDHSTMTWEWPCKDAWGLMATDKGNSRWDVFIAPATSTEFYTVVFFYTDNSMAIGIVSVP